MPSRRVRISARRLLAANGTMAEEIVEVRVPQRRGDDLVISKDEGIREGVTAESLGKLKPAFGRDGSITAGSSSPISDGAAAMVVMSKEAAERLGATPIAEIGAYASVAGPDSSLQLQPANAIDLAVKKQQISVADLQLIEINEAFAAVGVASARSLGLSEEETDEKVNVNGGAIALGHPIGASGARLLLTLAMELRRRGGGTGVAALCGGGGQGDALIITVPTDDQLPLKRRAPRCPLACRLTATTSELSSQRSGRVIRERWVV